MFVRNLRDNNRLTLSSMLVVGENSRRTNNNSRLSMSAAK